MDRIVEPPRRGWIRRKRSAIFLADRARDAGQWELAVQLYRQALRKNPRNPPIWVQCGHALKESGELRDPGKLVQAEIAYRQAVSLDPSAADYHLHLGHVLKLQGRKEEAEAAYLRAVALDGSMAEPLRELNGLGWSKAQTAELQTLSLSQDAPAAKNLNTHAVSLADMPQRAAAIPDRGSLRSGGKANVITLSEHARETGQWETAARLYRKTLDRNPRDPPAWVQYGQTIKKSGAPSETEVAYRRVISYGSRNAASYLQLGHVLKLRGKTEEAKASYLRAFALDPSLPYPLQELSGLGWADEQIAELIRLVRPTSLDPPIGI